MYNATVVKRIQVADNLIILRIKPDWQIPDFKPGQYVAIGLSESEEDLGDNQSMPTTAKIIKRAYSIATPPRQKNYLEFYIALVEGGELTTKIGKLVEASRLFVTPKITGSFTLDGVPEGKNMIFISTGTGIAPYISMIENGLSAQEITLIHGVRHDSDLAYREICLNWEKTLGNFRYLPIVSRPTSEWQGRVGRVQALFESGEVKTDPLSDHIFLCGNPAMVDQMESYLKALGFKEHLRRDPGNLHLEKYW
ncbi:MAG TPA: ferredoxin--NADP reductase [Oligoflexia bacterium]|nr:ferredoxin--NADP reductase [Oligoflexia bacterium]HMP27273.1 ferredoxin--NADP reductase [Oligoflexia bacterium]